MSNTRPTVKIGGFMLAFFTAILAFQGFSQTHLSEPVFEEIWLGKPTVVKGERLSFTLRYPETVLSTEAIPLELEIMTSIPYQQCVISVSLQDSTANNVKVQQKIVDLQRGRNDMSIQWYATNLLPGKYQLEVAVDYAESLAPALYWVPLKRASATHWRKMIEELSQQVSQLKTETLHNADPTSGPGNALGMPTLEVRKLVIKEALACAQRALEARQWTIVDRNLEYARSAYDTLRAEITFSSTRSELSTPHCVYPERIEVRDYGFYAENRPLFLIGTQLAANLANRPSEATSTFHPLSSLLSNAPTSPENQIEWMTHHGLNFALINVSIGIDDTALRSYLDRLTEAAGKHRVPWSLQIDYDDIAGALMDTWPELLESDFVNLAHEGFSSVYKQKVLEIFKNIAAQACPPVSVSLATNPRFKYEGGKIRLQFIERIKERYPDRIDLNRLWRAHLADYDEIVIWGDPKEYRYMGQRSYQYEWQDFHRELINLFFAGIKNELAALGPHIPVMVTSPNTAFLAGETRNTPSREDLARIMDINGCIVDFSSKSDLYAMNYPYPHAYLTLMRSYATEKPLVIMNIDIDVTELGEGQLRESLVYSAVWEAVMCGASGMALALNSSVYNYPEALAAYATAAMDVNRLAPLIMAFQQSQAPIAILFSEASKIMDDGVPHLESARYAFEGASFAGFSVRFLSEKEIESGGLEDVKVLILPNTMAVPDSTFEQLSNYVESGNMVARVGTPIPYNEKGNSRADVIRATANTLLVRGMNLPTEYLHAMDAALVGGVLPEIARPVNAFGYPLEGVRSEYVLVDGIPHLYIINLRKHPVVVFLTGLEITGRDLIRGRDIAFPRELQPLDPMLIRLDKEKVVFTVSR